MAQFTTFEIVSDGQQEGIGGHSSLALDVNGNPHIAFMNGAGEVRYAHKTDGTWAIERLPTGTLMALGSDSPICIAVTSKLIPNIVYENRADGTLIFGEKTDGWVFTTIPTPASVTARGGRDYSLALDPSRESRDTPHVSFHDLFHNSLAHSARTAGNWQSVQVDTSEPPFDTGLRTSLAFDPPGKPTIAYCQQRKTGTTNPPFVRILKLAEPQVALEGLPQQWTSAVVDGDVKLVELVSLTKASSSSLVSYFDRADKVLRARVTSFDIPGPRLETVVSGSDVKHISTGAHGRGFRIAYNDGQLKLASRSMSGEWSVQTVDEAGGEWASLAYDNAGNAHIAYQAGPMLKYATGAD